MICLSSYFLTVWVTKCLSAFPCLCLLWHSTIEMIVKKLIQQRNWFLKLFKCQKNSEESEKEESFWSDEMYLFTQPSEPPQVHVHLWDSATKRPVVPQKLYRTSKFKCVLHAENLESDIRRRGVSVLVNSPGPCGSYSSFKCFVSVEETRQTSNITLLCSLFNFLISFSAQYFIFGRKIKIAQHSNFFSTKKSANFTINSVSACTESSILIYRGKSAGKLLQQIAWHHQSLNCEWTRQKNAGEISAHRNRAF